MQYNFKISTLFACLAGLAGCAAFPPDKLSKPGTVTIENAMVDVGKGFAGMRAELKKADMKLGLDACKVTVNFHVTSSADQDGKLVLDLTAKPSTTATSTVTNISATSNITQDNKSHTDVGNIVNIEMYNVACLPKETLAYEHPDKVSLVVDALEQNGRRRNTTAVTSPGGSTILKTPKDVKTE